MKISARLTFALLGVLPACWLPKCEAPRPPRVYNEVYLPFKQPNRDPGYPKMSIVRDDGGRYFEMNRRSPYAWGQRHTVQVTATYNRVSQFTDRRTKHLHSEDDLDGQFRLHGISSPYFGEDRRSFIDGKTFHCPQEVCNLLDTRLRGRARFDMLMSFGTTSTAPLNLEAVQTASCYNYLDCTVRQECCDRGGEFGVCEAFEACPKDLRMGLD